MAAGDKLLNYVAPNVSQAVNALRERLAHLDGYPSGGESAGKVSASSPDTATERVAARRLILDRILDDLREAITDCCHTIDLLGRMADDALRDAQPDYKPVEAAVCRDAQHGKDGNLEWGDVLCTRSPVKAGLCSAHYQRWYRWRTEHGIDTSRDFAA